MAARLLRLPVRPRAGADAGVLREDARLLLEVAAAGAVSFELRGASRSSMARFIVMRPCEIAYYIMYITLSFVLILNFVQEILFMEGMIGRYGGCPEITFISLIKGLD